MTHPQPTTQVPSRKALLAICEQGLDLATQAGADHAEVALDWNREQEASLQANDLDQVRSSDETTIGIRVLVDGRPGFATTNRSDDLQATVDAAVAMARAAPPDPLAVLASPQPYEDVPDALDDGVLALSPADLASMAMGELRRIRALDPRLTIDSGAISADISGRALASSSGIRAAWRCTSASGYLMGMAVDGKEVGSFAYDGDAVRRWADLPHALEVALQRFVDSSIGALGATAGRSFRGAIVLPPHTFAELLISPLLGGLAADGVRTGTSPFKGRIGESVAIPGLTVSAGGRGLAGHPVAPFDREGMPRVRRKVVDQGVLKGFFTDGREAAAAGQASSGDAVGGAGSLPRPSATAVSVDRGTASIAALEADGPVVIVTRWSGSTNPVSGEFSGVVKGGFLVENGERRPIRETTIAGNVWEALHQISALSHDRSTFYGSSRYPWARVEDVSVTAG